MPAKELLQLQIVETLTFVTTLFGRWEERLRDRATSPPSSQVGQAKAGEKERTQAMKSRKNLESRWDKVEHGLLMEAVMQQFYGMVKVDGR